MLGVYYIPKTIVDLNGDVILKEISLKELKKNTARCKMKLK